MENKNIKTETAEKGSMSNEQVINNDAAWINERRKKVINGKVDTIEVIEWLEYLMRHNFFNLTYKGQERDLIVDFVDAMDWRHNMKED